MDRSSSETLSSNSSSSAPSRHRRSAHSKRRTPRVNVFPYAPHSVPNPWVAASNADPLKSLESRLLPHDPRYPSTPYYSSSVYNFLPPVLHAGWPINEDALLEWCTNEGFDRTTYDINDRLVFDYRSTVASAVSYLAQRSGLTSVPDPYTSSAISDHGSSNSDEVEIVPYIQSTCNQKAPLIVALVSNYEIEGVKRLGSIKNKIYAFGKILLREGLLLDVGYDDPSSPTDGPQSKSSSPSVESPRWYLDYKQWQWVPVPKEDLGSSNNLPVAPVDGRLKVKVALKAKVSNSALRPANRILESPKLAFS